MRNMSETLWVTWENGDFTGPNRPITRAVIQKAVLKHFGNMRTNLFQQTELWYEIPNIMTINIDKRLNTDAATMTLTFANLEPVDATANLDEPYDPSLSITEASVPTRRDLGDLGRPGLYSYRRGITPDSAARWGHDTDDTWVDMFIPNRLIKTFQGWGTDGAANAWEDTKLVPTGVWLIDRVEYKSNATITLHCRDQAKLLIEQRLYPPIVPLEHYVTESGLSFCADHEQTTTQPTTTTTTISVPETTSDDLGGHVSTYPDSGAAPWVGYNGTVYGHRASHAFDGDESTYWMSVGSSGPNKLWSFSWIESDTRGEPVNRIRYKPKWGNYKVYVCIKENGQWVGDEYVPYGYWTEPAKPNGSYTPYVSIHSCPAGEGWVEIDLDRDYSADRVRLTFTNLQNSGLGTYPYRAAVYEMEVVYHTPASSEEQEEESEEDVTITVPGNITDYTDIVKVLCAWSGFWWPKYPNDPVLADFAGDDIVNDLTGGYTPPETIVQGRVWGDFFYSGAYPVEPPCIPSSFWDNKSVMDGINQIKEILGFIFFIDSTGGVVWRMPNIWRTGNFITGTGYVGEDSVREISETQVLIDYGVQVDDTNLRSEIIVVAQGDPTLHSSIIPGWGEGETVPQATDPLGDLALLGGQQRVMLVPNYPFISQEEVDKFAYLVSLWIHWSYRKSKFRIPGNPAFEPDDQVRIYERVTSETYVHYIQAVRSSMDMTNGTWFCDIDTHWLGAGPDEQWHVSTYANMPPALFAYLWQTGNIDSDSDPADWPLELPPGFEIPDFPIETPRLDDDLDELFPDPPPIDYGDIDDTWSPEDIDDTYGDGETPSGGVYWRSGAWRKAYWGSNPPPPLSTFTFARAWQSSYNNYPHAQQISIRTHPGQTRTVSSQVAALAKPAYILLAQILMEEHVNVYYAGSYAYRTIEGSSTLSAHSWGLAIDINPQDFTCCSDSRSTIYGNTDGPEFLKAADRIINEIRTGNGNRVFGWGGKWKSKRDWMHFEVVVTPDDLRSGVSR